MLLLLLCFVLLSFVLFCCCCCFSCFCFISFLDDFSIFLSFNNNVYWITRCLAPKELNKQTKFSRPYAWSYFNLWLELGSSESCLSLTVGFWIWWKIYGYISISSNNKRLIYIFFFGDNREFLILACLYIHSINNVVLNSLQVARKSYAK